MGLQRDLCPACKVRGQVYCAAQCTAGGGGGTVAKLAAPADAENLQEGGIAALYSRLVYTPSRNNVINTTLRVEHSVPLVIGIYGGGSFGRTGTNGDVSSVYPVAPVVHDIPLNLGVSLSARLLSSRKR